MESTLLDLLPGSMPIFALECQLGSRSTSQVGQSGQAIKRINEWDQRLSTPMFVLFLFFLWRNRAWWRVATATAWWRRWWTSFSTFTFMFFNFPMIQKYLLLLFVRWGWWLTWTWWTRRRSSSSFSLLNHLYLSRSLLRKSGQSFFLNIYICTNVPFFRINGTHH